MLKLEEFKPKIIDKKVFVNYYDNKNLEEVISNMGHISTTSEKLRKVKSFIENCEAWHEGTAGVLLINVYEEVGDLLQYLPFIRKACQHADNLMKNLKSGNFIRDKESTKRFLDEYQTIFEDLMQGYRKILKERVSEL